MRIVFMGTPEFAVPSFMALVQGGYDVAAAVTQPDKPRGRGKRTQPCPVKEAAQAAGVTALQFPRIRSAEGVKALRALDADLFVTAAFGQILSQEVLDIPRRGTINVHASLLPAYRGPAPINWCIIEGETVTGVTTMRTDAGVDTGDMLLNQETPIGPEETAGELSARLSQMGAALLLETLSRLEAGTLTPIPQDDALATRHPMLKKEMGRIDWTWPACRIHDLVRGVNPWPGAYTHLPDGGVLKIWASRVAEGHGRPGEVLRADAKGGLLVAAGSGALEIQTLQAPGARRMATADYLRGHPMDVGAMILGGMD